MRRINLILISFAFACLAWHIESIDAFAQLRWFDIYSDVTVEEETVHLDNFAYFLKKDPKLIGYIGFFVGKDDKYKKVKRRALKAKEYLMKEYDLPESRIVVLYGGKNPDTQFVLQPKISSEPPPRFRIGRTREKEQ